MKPFHLIFLVLLVLSRIETNEATRNLDKTHLLLPSLQTRSPVQTPSPNPGTEASMNMASRVTERNFVGSKEIFTPPPPTNAYTLDETHLLLPSLKTRSPVKTPSPNPGTEASVNMTSRVTERNFVGHKKVILPPPPSTNAYPVHEPRLFPSLQTHLPVKTPSPNPGTEASNNMASRVTEKNFVGHKKVFTIPPPTNTYHFDESHFLLPSMQTRSPVKTPSPNSGTEASVNMASKITERNFIDRKAVFTPPPPPTNTYPLDETHLLLPYLKTHSPVKTPSTNPGTEVSVIMVNRIAERNFDGRKEVVFAPPPPLPSTNAYPLHEPHLLPSLQTYSLVKTPSPNPGTEVSVNMASRITERNFVGRKEVGFAPPFLLPSNNAYPLREPLLLPYLQTRFPVNTPTPNSGTEAI